MKAKIRKIMTVVDETLTEQGQAVSPPIRRAAAIAVIANPCAGKFQEDLSELIDIGEELGQLLAERAVAALGVSGSNVESYGKAAAVGENGELEHAAAILHPKLGAPFRKVLGKPGLGGINMGAIAQLAMKKVRPPGPSHTCACAQMAPLTLCVRVACGQPSQPSCP